MQSRFAMVLLFFCLLPLTLARAEDPLVEAQKIISQQIAALQANDAKAAYSFASPDIRSRFQDEAVFLGMIQALYQPLFGARNYAFGRSKLVGGGETVFQEVILSGRDGKDATAIYDLRLQDDGSYKINGVRMLAKTASTGI
ncbi:DUF4864 domain-containing protein [Rhizobium helianthi]|uniref:DUF4864 domain-containing protein n=1 Tax=Rhizobium helianthi TaxID=1132695 RepID=A0ABW4M1I6_9HYPH